MKKREIRKYSIPSRDINQLHEHKDIHTKVTITNQWAKNSTTAKVAGVSFRTASKFVAFKSTA